MWKEGGVERGREGGREGGTSIKQQYQDNEYKRNAEPPKKNKIRGEKRGRDGGTSIKQTLVTTNTSREI